MLVKLDGRQSTFVEPEIGRGAERVPYGQVCIIVHFRRNLVAPLLSSAIDYANNDTLGQASNTGD